MSNSARGLNPVQGVIFDFDGPIFDGRAASQKALIATFDKFAASVGRPTVVVDTLPLYGPAALIALTYAECPGATQEQLPSIRDCYVSAVRDCERQSKVDDRIRDLLNDLKERGIKCAILSSRPEAELLDLVGQLGLSDAFDEVWGRDTGSHGKPSPSAVSALTARLGIAPPDLVYVGDSDRDYDATVGTSVPYYHAAWTGEPGGRAYRDCAVLLRSSEDLKSVLRDSRPYRLGSHKNIPDKLVEAIRADRLVFYAGAGVSVPSGIGGWDDHYLPILRELGVGPWVDDFDLPQLLQLVAATRPEDVYQKFRESFRRRQQRRPGSYHYAMIRSGAAHIWTTNYDQLFEGALAGGGFPHLSITDDDSLMENFEHSHLILKMNGDFEHSTYGADLAWDVVFLEEQFDLAERQRREIWRLFEDDYRSSSIVFVGTSFTDPALRRLLSNAAKAVSRTRFPHHLLVKAARHPAARIIESMYIENLKRIHVETHLFNDFADIERWVQQVAMVANRPIIGFSGTGKQENGVLSPGGVLENGSITTADIVDLCGRLGGALAECGFRVSSGHGPGVGVPSVEAAFQKNPAGARFYLRRRGSSQYSRTAPAVIIPGDDFGAMRERFIGELDLLVAIGGDEPGAGGTETEIDMALKRSIPVIILRQGGGAAARRKPAMMQALSETYSDPKLAVMIRKLNEELDMVAPDALPGYVRGTLIHQIEDLIAVSLSTFEQRAADDETLAAQRKW